MATNDFSLLASALSPDFVLEWPQSKERIRGADRFIRMNQEYPTFGPWRFTINRIVGGETEVTTDVTVTDGTQTARAISVFTAEKDKIRSIVEYWPEPYAAPANRAQLIEVMD